MWSSTHSLQFLSKSALQQVSESESSAMAGAAPNGVAAGRVFPCRVHRPRTDRRTGLPEQEGGLRHSVPRGERNASHDCSGSQAPRGRTWISGRAAHLGTNAGAPSPYSLRGAWRWPGTRWTTLDLLPTAILSAGESIVT